ncbi:MAG: pitrilysin family protein, partial [Bacteroidota bacterium]
MKTKVFLFCLALLCGWTFQSCDTASSGGGVDANQFKIDYEKFTLDNGLEVILHQDKSDPIVAVAIMFHVGSNREKVGRTGFAHFFEHMLFQNSENVGKGNFFKTIEELGGDFNGGTWNDGTVYYEVVPKDALERILWMESDRMGFLINTVTVPVLENEKQVVKNEKRQRVDNQPYGHTNYVIDKALYPEDHPYNWQVIGSLEDLQNATLEDVKEFYDQWYGPNNATMVIAGDFDLVETKAMIKKYFDEIPSKAEVASLEARGAVVTETVKLMHEDNFANLPELRMVFPTVADGHPDSYALNYLGQLLSQGKRAPLYKEIVENQKLAPSTSSYNSTREIAGNFYFRIRANDGVDLDQVVAGVNTAMEQFEANGIDDRDMERIRNSLETDFYGGISSILSKAFQLAQYNEFRNDPDALVGEIESILGVTKEDVMRVYETYIKGKPYIMTSFVPRGQTDLAVEGSEIA